MATADRSYTHIVVGAGSAGCVVASRVSENADYNVLLLEAGPDQDALQGSLSRIHESKRVPMQGQSEKFDPKIDWNLQVHIPGSSPMRVPQAKLVGGGSSINGGTALRSTNADSKEWVQLGNDAWDFQSVCKVYDTLENDQVRGTKGLHPIKRVTPEEMGRIQSAFLEGSKEVGFKQILDLNETGAEGAGPSPVCRALDRRVSAADTFLNPVRHRKNLIILTEVLVDRVLFNGKTAIGVILATGQHITCTHEVILSAGAILSPAILQRSGVGPRDVLLPLNIMLVVDLPVGLHLSDHPCIPIVAKPRDGAYNNQDYSLQCQARWSSSTRSGAIDHQMVCFSYLFALPRDPKNPQRSLAGGAEGHVAGIGCNVNKPIASGTTFITSREPEVLPLVTYNYLGEQSDKASAREIVRTAYRVIKSASMQAVLEEPLGIDDSVIRSDAKLDEYCQAQVTSTYHFCCSCRMAPRSNGGVVDQSGRVYGVTALRVCDASITPTVPASNNMWTTMMFADRIGRSIRDHEDVTSTAGVSAKL